MAVYRTVNGVLTKLAGSCTSIMFSVVIPTSGWVSNWNGGVDMDITVNGIASTDNPIVSLEILDTDNATTSKNKRISFSCIDRIDTNDNSIRVFCLDANQVPTTEFSVLIRK